MKTKACSLILLLVTVTLLGCTTVPLLGDRYSVAAGIAGPAGFIKDYIKAGDFRLMTYQRFNKSSDIIRIYIEGDGMAWESRDRLSDDPTPMDPVALRLAAVDPGDNIAYIARPGQYPHNGFPDCDPKYWSSAIFAPEVISSFNRVIDLLKARAQAAQVELIGFSGGGAVAVLVASQRSDVISLRTVAGNLDPAAFCQFHHVSQLEGSLDPMDAAAAISHIPQRHFSGARDTVVPAFIARSFARKEGDPNDDRITIVQGCTHTKGWQQRWNELLSLKSLK